MAARAGGAGGDEGVLVLRACACAGRVFVVQAVTNLSYYERSDSVIWQHTRAVARGASPHVPGAGGGQA